MIIDELFESPQQCPECGGISFSDLILAEKKDACYHKVKASAKVWPSAYASGRLVQCRKKGAANYGNKSEGVAEAAGLYGPFTVTINTGERPQSRTKTKKFRREDDAILWAQDWLEDAPQYVFATAEVTDSDGNVVWTTDEQGVAEAKTSTQQDDRNFQDQADYGGEDPDARDQYGNLKRSTSPGLGGTIDIGGVDIPAGAFDAGLGSAAAMGGIGGMKGMFSKPRDLGTTSQDIATGRSVGGKAIPSLGQAGKVVTSPTADKALTKLGGKNVSTTSGPTVTVQKRGSEYEPLAVDVPAYVRQGKPDPSTTPKPGTKLTIKVRPGETMDQAIQRTKAEQEFGKFLQGQGGQKFGTSTTAQATSDAGQVPTIRLPNGQVIVDPARLSPSGQYKNTEMDKIIQKWDKEQQSAPSLPSSSSKSKTSPSKFLQMFGPDKMDEEARKKRKEPEVDYDAIDHDKSVARLRHLAGIGPMKTVWDPARRVYKNVPTADQPPKK